MQINLIHNGVRIPIEEKAAGVGFDLMDWARGQVNQAIENMIMEGVANYLAQVVIALPVLAIVCLSIWFFFQMFSKALAKFSVIGALIYGLIVIAL